MSDGGEGFLARWSRRKAGIAPADDASPAAAPRGAPPAAAPPAASPPVERDSLGAAPAEPAAAEPPPTLADVAALTRDSDYARFMRPGVDGGVRNAAMKKLFSDPRFNVMDGLDIYIDDYGKPDPLPVSMLRQLNQAAMLGLFADDDAPAAPANEPRGDKAGTDGTPPPGMAASKVAAPPANDPAPRADDDPDLRLQPDDADRRPGAGADPRP
ncbi:MAG: DUF3306 domain-containing protein [Caldimonas sp.]